VKKYSSKIAAKTKVINSKLHGHTFTYNDILYTQEMTWAGERRVVGEFYFQILFFCLKEHPV